MKRKSLLIAIAYGLAIVGLSRPSLHGMEKLRQLSKWWGASAQTVTSLSKEPQKPMQSSEPLEPQALSIQRSGPLMTIMGLASAVPGSLSKTLGAVKDIYYGRVPQGWESWGRTAQAGLFLGTASAVVLSRRYLATLGKMAIIGQALFTIRSIIDTASAKEKESLNKKIDELLKIQRNLAQELAAEKALEEHRKLELLLKSGVLTRGDLVAEALLIGSQEPLGNFYIINKKTLDNIYSLLHGNNGAALRLINIVQYASYVPLARTMRDILIALMNDPKVGFVTVRDLLEALTPEYIFGKTSIDEKGMGEYWAKVNTIPEKNQIPLDSRNQDLYMKHAALVAPWAEISNKIKKKLSNLTAKEHRHIAFRLFQELLKEESLSQSGVIVEVLGEVQDEQGGSEKRKLSDDEISQLLHKGFDKPEERPISRTEKIAETISSEVMQQRKTLVERSVRPQITLPSSSTGIEQGPGGESWWQKGMRYIGM